MRVKGRRAFAGDVRAGALLLIASVSLACRSTADLAPAFSLPTATTTQDADPSLHLPSQPTDEDTTQGRPEVMAFVGKLVLSEGSALYRVDVNCDEVLSKCTGESQRLTDLPALYTSPTWSPDGHQVLFSSDLNPEVSDVLGVFVVGEWGGAPRSLASAGHDPDWAPDGDQVAFATWEGGGGIMLVTPDSDARLVIREPLPSHPSWSTDGSRIAYLGGTLGSGSLFVGYLPDGAADLAAINATGFIDWSPSSERVAFTAASDDKADLFILPAAISPGSIGEAQRIATDGSVSYPAWSPDGTQLAFVSREEGDRNIYVATLRCTDADDACQVNVRQVTDGPDAETNPIWFPDGNHLVYLAGRGSSWRLEMVDLDNQDPQLLVDGLTSPRELDGYIE